MTKFSTISLYLTKLYVTLSFAIASSGTYSEIRQNFSNSVVTVMVLGWLSAVMMLVILVVVWWGVPMVMIIVLIAMVVVIMKVVVVVVGRKVNGHQVGWSS